MPPQTKRKPIFFFMLIHSKNKAVLKKNWVFQHAITKMYVLLKKYVTTLFE